MITDEFMPKPLRCWGYYFPNYQITVNGRIQSLFNSRKRRRLIPYTLKQRECVDGYKVVDVCKRYIKIHRAVLESFIGLPEIKNPCALHNDGNKLNNHLDNLRWGTQKENMEDREKHGNTIKGEMSPHAKLTEDAVKRIRFCSSRGKSSRFIAAIYQVSHTTILKIIKGEKWSHVPQN